MDSYLGERGASRNLLAPSPVLIAGTSAAALARAAETVEASGFRIADRVPIERASERIEQQAAATAIWLELDNDRGALMDRLLDQISRGVRNDRYAAVVSTPCDMIDPVAARIQGSQVELIADGDDAERATALALVTSGFGRQQRVSDVAGDKSAARLRQLSDEVSRIASTLARLSAGPAATTAPAEPEPTEIPEVSADVVRSVIRARRLRSRFFPDDLFADPAWDMLLDLLQAEIAQLRVPVSSLCIAATVPATTALRWLKTMTDRGLFMRRADPHDGRRVFVELAPKTSLAMRRYFAEVGRPAVI